MRYSNFLDSQVQFISRSSHLFHGVELMSCSEIYRSFIMQVRVAIKDESSSENLDNAYFFHIEMSLLNFRFSKRMI